MQMSFAKLSVDLLEVNSPGKGAGTNAQLAFLALSASDQYRSPEASARFILDAASLNASDDLRSDSSFHPSVSCALYACIDGCNAGLLIVEESRPRGGSSESSGVIDASGMPVTDLR